MSGGQITTGGTVSMTEKLNMNWLGKQPSKSIASTATEQYKNTS
jgi:hypothetical protein